MSQYFMEAVDTLATMSMPKKSTSSRLFENELIVLSPVVSVEMGRCGCLHVEPIESM